MAAAARGGMRRSPMPLQMCLLLALAGLICLSITRADNPTIGGVSVWERVLELENADDEEDIVLVGSWDTSSVPGYSNTCQYATGAAGNGDASATFYVRVPDPDYYEVLLSYCSHINRSPEIEVIIAPGLVSADTYFNESYTFIVNQSAPEQEGHQIRLQSRYINEGALTVIVRHKDPNYRKGTLSLDAIRVRQGILVDSQESEVELYDLVGRQDAVNATFNMPIDEVGYYGVYFDNFHSGNTLSPNVPVQVSTAGSWVFVGSFRMSPANNKVVVFGSGTSKAVVLDACYLLHHEILDTESTGVTVSGSWRSSSAIDGYVGVDYLVVQGSNDDDAFVEYPFQVAKDGLYTLEATYRGGLESDTTDDRSSRIQVMTTSAFGAQLSVFMDQTTSLNGWEYKTLGYFSLPEGTTRVRVRAKNTGSLYTVADAMRLSPIESFTIDSSNSEQLSFFGSKTVSDRTMEAIGGDFLIFSKDENPSAAVRATLPTLRGFAIMDLYLRFPPYATACTNASISVYQYTNDPNPRTMYIDQSTQTNAWIDIGHVLSGPSAASVRLVCLGTGSLIFDGLMFRFKQMVPTLALDNEEGLPNVINGPGFIFSNANTPYDGFGYSYTRQQTSARYMFTAPVAGTYALYHRYTLSPNRGTNVAITLADSQGGSQTGIVDQTAGTGFTRVMTADVPAGGVNVTLYNDPSLSRYTIADSMYLVLISESCDGLNFERDPRDLVVPRCLPLDTCKPGSFLSGADLCEYCAEGYYTATENQTECQRHTVCAAGESEQVAPTRTSDRECASCADGSFNTDGQGSCQPCAVSCPASQYIDSPCVPTSNITCADCGSCVIGQFIAKPCGADSNTVCGFCDGVTNFSSTFNADSCTKTTPCPAGNYITVPATPTSDLTCVACSRYEVDDDENPTTPCVYALVAQVPQYIQTIADAATQIASGTFTATGDYCQSSSDVNAAVDFYFDLEEDNHYQLLMSYCEGDMNSKNVTVQVFAPSQPNDRRLTASIDETIVPMANLVQLDPDNSIGSVPVNYLYLPKGPIRVRVSSTSINLSVHAIILRSGIIIDSEDATQASFLGSSASDFTFSSFSPGFVGTGYYVHSHDDPSGPDVGVVFRPSLPRAGQFTLRMSNPSLGTNLDTLTITVHHRDGRTIVPWLQGAHAGTWFIVGTFVLDPGCNITATTEGGGLMVIDAMWLEELVQMDSEEDSAIFVGEWQTSTSRSGYLGSNYHYVRGSAAQVGYHAVTYPMRVVIPGLYQLQMSWRGEPDDAITRARNTPVVLTTKESELILSVDQNEYLDEGAFRGLAFVELEEGVLNVTINNVGAHRIYTSDISVVIADAVRLVPHDAIVLRAGDATSFYPSSAWTTGSTAGVFGASTRVSSSTNAKVTFTVPKTAGLIEYEVYTVFQPSSSLSTVVSTALMSSFSAVPVTATLNQRTGTATYRSLGRQIFGYNEGTITLESSGGDILIDTLVLVPRAVVPAELVDFEYSARVEQNGLWLISRSISGFNGGFYAHDNRTMQGTKSITYNFDVSHDGLYSLRASAPRGDLNYERNTRAALLVTNNGQTVYSGIYNTSTGYDMTELTQLNLTRGVLRVIITNSGDAGRYTVVDAFALTMIAETCDLVNTVPASDTSFLVPRCVDQQPCPAGHFRADPLSACEPCGAMQFVGTTNASECQDWQDCGFGSYISVEGTSTTDRVCATCADGYFTDEINLGLCKTCSSSCPSGSHIDAACTIYGDVTCEPDTNCSAGHYLAVQGDGVVDNTCLPCQDCPAGTAVTVECTLLTNRKCRACDPLLEYSTSINSEYCRNNVLSSCQVGSELTAAPNATFAGTCRQCDAGTTDHDADVTTPCQACSAGFFKEAGGRGNCTQCFEGQADTDSNPATPCVRCADLGRYQDVAGQTKCLVPTVCGAGQEQVAPATGVSDTEGYFKSRADQVTDVSVCQAVSTCGQGYFEAAVPTTTSDRLCTQASIAPLYLAVPSVFAQLMPEDLEDIVYQSILSSNFSVETALEVGLQTRARRATASVLRSFNVYFRSNSSAVAFGNFLTDQGLLIIFPDNSTSMASAVPIVTTTTRAATAATEPGTTANAGSSAVKSSSNNNVAVIAVAAALGVVVLVVVVVLVMRQRRKKARKTAEARSVIAFENPTYAVNDQEEKFNPIYDNDTVGLEDPGYMEPPAHASPGDFDAFEGDAGEEGGYLDLEGANQGGAADNGYLKSDELEAGMGFGTEETAHDESGYLDFGEDNNQH
ncbi:uncharacterized protein MONBRDRAFT_34072 [Monosiga brevicollis MX1]|uniref:TNFR-Cys domain-containing protein n=1 Tax=Monosiga brevicollis TaxID=81824 RepID=A9V9B5_MONBE|nr:uncharacterized protein MONBRDRAFT_34072 [Monosiga brevicollis MX1]EDQ85902.1 predicted protein [Monosiga brevicollis MX1]|eukprot:XP_001749381.1 hypothetical protein [Monosiga brevicollis MX1]